MKDYSLELEGTTVIHKVWANSCWAVIIDAHDQLQLAFLSDFLTRLERVPKQAIECYESTSS